MAELHERLMAIRYLQKTKTIYEDKLAHCLKIPIYKYFHSVYNDCFDDKVIKKDSDAVVVFQEKLMEIRNYQPNQVNEQAVKILSYASNCSVYIAKVIDAVLTSNNRCQLLSIDAEERYYMKQIPNSLLFFKTLLSQMADVFVIDPFIFCKDTGNTKILKCINETLNLINTCIYNTISVLSFDDEHLDEYIDFVNNMHLSLKEIYTLNQEPKFVTVTNLDELKPVEDLEKEAKKELEQKIDNFVSNEVNKNPLLEDIEQNVAVNLKKELGLKPQNVVNKKEDWIMSNDEQKDISEDEEDYEEVKLDKVESESSNEIEEIESNDSKSDNEIHYDENNEEFIPEQLAFIPYKDKTRESIKKLKKKRKNKKKKKTDFDLNNT